MSSTMIKLNLIDRMVIYSVYIILIIDTVNGIMLRINYQIGISVIFKFLVMILMIIYLFNKSKNYILVLTGIFLLYTVLQIFYFSIDNNLNAFYKSINYLTKIIFIFLCYKFFYHSNINYSQIKNIFYISLGVVVFNLSVGFLGFGYSQYTAGEIGTVGFFFSGNELSALMIIIFSFILYNNYRNNNYILYLILSVIFVFLGIIKATKVAILGIILVIILVPIVYERNKILKFTKFKFYFALGIAFILIIMASLFNKYFIDTLIYHRLVYFIENFGLITAIFSMRDVFAKTAFDYFLQNYNLFIILFGRGYWFFYIYDQNIFHDKIIEIDPIDVFFMFGSLGLILVFSLYFHLLYKAFRQIFNNRKIFAPFVFIINLILILASFTSGHIVYSGLTGLFFALSNSLLRFTDEDIINKQLISK